MGSLAGKIASRIYTSYRFKLFPRIKGIRGATRAAKILEKLSWKGLEEIEEEHSIRDREWKNLLILDACRHDTYDKKIKETESINSVGGASKEFIAKTFSQGDFSDIIYITANPYFHPPLFKEATGREIEDVFHEVFHLYQTDWNSKESTVMPEKVVERALTTEKLFPEKRKIIHFMQPHYPFIDADFSEAGFDTALEGEDAENVWVRLMRGELSHEKVVEAYEQNLEYVMPYAEEIVKKLSGKTVITSDHGNLLGENNLYGHPEKCRAKPLRKVPWDERN